VYTPTFVDGPDGGGPFAALDGGLGIATAVGAVLVPVLVATFVVTLSGFGVESTAGAVAGTAGFALSAFVVATAGWSGFAHAERIDAHSIMRTAYELISDRKSGKDYRRGRRDAEKRRGNQDLLLFVAATRDFPPSSAFLCGSASSAVK